MKSLVFLFALLAVSFAAPDPHRYIVAFDNAPKFLAGKFRLAELGVKPLLEVASQNILAAHLEDAVLAKVQSFPEVSFVEQDVPRYSYGKFDISRVHETLRKKYAAAAINETSGDQVTPYGITNVQALLVSDDKISSRRVCIIDSGYDGAHEDLQHDSHVTGDNDASSGAWNVDECGHGTHVAGTISALDNDKGVLGVARNGDINLHIIKVFSGTDCAWTYSSNLINAVDLCRKSNANVISMSLGSALPSQAEKTAFDNAYNLYDILNVAAAGNDGTTRNSYPASYASVISVAAVDSNNVRASFSQYNANVEISAPGVGVLSTVPMGTGEESTLAYGTGSYVPQPLDGSPALTAQGTLFNCGLGGSVCACPPKSIAIIQRGEFNFTFKVENAQAGGCLGAIIYNNVAGSFLGTLNGAVTTIPSVTLSLDEGNAALATLSSAPSTVATLAITKTNYAYYDGTSMATPHVSAVAALIWSYKPGCPNTVIREILQSSALRLGTGVPNNEYGYGLVQALAGQQALQADSRC